MSIPTELPIPADVDAEESTLGSILIEPRSIQRVAGRLKAGDFYREKNRWVYEAMEALAEEEMAIDQVTLAAQLARDGKLAPAGGAAYLSYLVSMLPTAVFIEHYAALVIRHARARELVRAAQDIRDLAFTSPADLDAALATAHERLISIARTSEREYRSAHDILLNDSMGILDPERAAQVTGLKTGFMDLDRVLSGLEAGRLYCVFGQTSVGKSQLALSIAGNAVREGHAVAIAALEMTADECLSRLVDRESGIERFRMRKDPTLFSDEVRTAVMEAGGVIAEWPLYIDDTRGLSVSQIRARLARCMAAHKVELVIVDHLGRISERAESETIAYAHAVKALHAMAGELRVPVLLIAQPNRQMEGRVDKRPQLADLRQTGEIEQTADVVLGIYVADYYRVRGHAVARADGIPTTDRDYRMEVHVLKNRQGPVGIVHLFYDIERGKLGSLANGA